MDGGGFVEGCRDFEAKIGPLLIISCIMAATEEFLFGYDADVLGGVTSSVLLYLSSLTATLFFAAGATRKVGRTLTMLIAHLFVVGIDLIISAAAAQNPIMLIICRILTGCGVGCAYLALDALFGLFQDFRKTRETSGSNNKKEK